MICPPQTKLVERRTRERGRLELARRCETASGTIEGPIVSFTSDGTYTTLHRRGEHLGVRHGAFVDATTTGTTTEVTFTNGLPTGSYTQRTANGTPLVTGAFDVHGQLDGAWRFATPDGGELASFTMTNGTGEAVMFDGGKIAYRAQCLAGLFHGAATFPSDHVRDTTITATFANGLPDGPYRATRGDGTITAEGTYQRGVPVGIWAMRAPERCLRREVMGDIDGCVSIVKDAPYTCTGHTGCRYAKPSIDGDHPHAPPIITTIRRCEVPALRP